MLINGSPISWSGTPVEQTDILMLGIEKGKSSGQAALEALALLIGLRTWPHHWHEEKTLVLTRSDALAALGALLKRSSPAQAVNKVMQEIALDCADGTCEVELVSHIPGDLNAWADALSRLEAPMAERKTVPVELRTVERASVGGRGKDWWKSEALRGRGG